MNNRTARILEAAIQGFIATGDPVSSGWLFDHHDFGIKPAMIRLELDALEEDGYLGQPYHSAGRVPTDMGYEFFASQVLQAARESRETALRELFAERAWGDLLRRLSENLGLLSVAADLDRDMVYKAGLENLIGRLDWEDREGVRAVIRDFEAMEGRVPGAAKKIGDEPKVFIGKKSPVTRSEQLSVVACNYHSGDSTVSLFAIGPKRMDYRRVVQIFKSL